MKPPKETRVAIRGEELLEALTGVPRSSPPNDERKPDFEVPNVIATEEDLVAVGRNVIEAVSLGKVDAQKTMALAAMVRALQPMVKPKGVPEPRSGTLPETQRSVVARRTTITEEVEVPTFNGPVCPPPRALPHPVPREHALPGPPPRKVNGDPES